jgi:hypothetical protein
MGRRIPAADFAAGKSHAVRAVYVSEAEADCFAVPPLSCSAALQYICGIRGAPGILTRHGSRRLAEGYDFGGIETGVYRRDDAYALET